MRYALYVGMQCINALRGVVIHTGLQKMYLYHGCESTLDEYDIRYEIIYGIM